VRDTLELLLTFAGGAIVEYEHGALPAREKLFES
jgi:hypothetical protein